MYHFIKNIFATSQYYSIKMICLHILPKRRIIRCAKLICMLNYNTLKIQFEMQENCTIVLLFRMMQSFLIYEGNCKDNQIPGIYSLQEGKLVKEETFLQFSISIKRLHPIQFSLDTLCPFWIHQARNIVMFLESGRITSKGLLPYFIQY